jgi:PAS domain S-box-containing protein
VALVSAAAGASAVALAVVAGALTLVAMEDLGAAATLGPVFALSPCILTVTGLDDGRIMAVNEAFVRTFGYSRDEVIGRPVPDLGLWVDPQQREEGLAAMRAGRSIRDLEIRFRTKRGDEIVAIANAAIVILDGRRSVLTALTDITDRVRAEAALRESEQRFAQAFNANPLPMSIVRLSDGRHLDVNEAAVRHSGYTREEMLGRTKPELGFWVAPEERERLLALLRTEGRARDFEVTFRTKSGEERQLLANSEVITYGGEPAVLSVSLDITERKELDRQREARRAEAETAARAKDEFLAMLGHELRNPLGAITNALAVLDRLLRTEDVRRLTGIIGRQTVHLTRLVDDLLDVARLTSGKIELRPCLVDLRDLTGRCVDAIAHAGRSARHVVTVEGDHVRVLADPGRLEQVVTNLLDNALKYTPAGGSVRVVTAHLGRDAVLRVQDSGEGIRPELLPRIFDLFVQGPQEMDRSHGGLGLGLTLVRRLVELHGGSVSAESAGVGLGSAFTVRLPALPDDVAESRVAVAAPTLTPRPRRVLIVEDSADARESLRLLLESAGHVVETAENARGGLEKLHGFEPEVALVDLGLPGMDGYAFARAVREDAGVRATYLIALTGYGQPEDQRRALAAGFDVHLTKPVDPERLAEFLARE